MPTSKDNQNIFDIQGVKNLPSCFLWGWHGSTNGCNMSVIPGIIIYYDSTISHCSCLVTIVPPRRHLQDEIFSLKFMVMWDSGQASKTKDCSWTIFPEMGRSIRAWLLTLHSLDLILNRDSSGIAQNNMLQTSSVWNGAIYSKGMAIRLGFNWIKCGPDQIFINLEVMSLFNRTKIQNWIRPSYCIICSINGMDQVTQVSNGLNRLDK